MMLSDISKTIVERYSTDIKYDPKLTDNIYKSVSEYFKSYNKLSLIPGYTPKVVKISDKNVNLINIREYIYKVIRVQKSIKTYGSKEFATKSNDVYNIIKVETDEKIKLFLLCAIFYVLDSIHIKNDFTSTKSVVGLDFEFNERKIALCQISIYPKRKHKYVFITDPNIMNSEYTSLMIETIFTSNMYRIVHGSDSLDIPYIFEELFMRDSEKIFKFTKSVIDTRFMCEYHKIYTTDTNKKCSIYDAMLYFKTITPDKYAELNKINDNMGPIQDVNWNLAKMSSYNVKYAAYDVLFLKEFVYDIIKLSKRDDTLRDNIRYIPYIERFIFLEKYGINTVVSTSKAITDPINNYLVKSRSGNKTMISLYNNIVDKMVIPEINIKVKNILDINYFKTPITLVLKRILYSAITERYTVYVNKNEMFTERITYKEMYKVLTDSGLGKLVPFFERFYGVCKIELAKIL
jgi:hypothetical protein